MELIFHSEFMGRRNDEVKPHSEVSSLADESDKANTPVHTYSMQSL
jgi:hypothetical protein